MASFELLKWRLNDMENICAELSDRIQTKDLWADKKIYTISVAVFNTMEELIKHKKRIITLEEEVKELKNEIQKLGTNATMRINDGI